MEMGKKLDKEVFTKIHETIGAASMCWKTPEGDGEFKSEQAANVAKELCDFINEKMIKKPKTIREQVTFFIKHLPKGLAVYSIQYFFQALLLYLGFKLWWPVTYWQALGIFITLRMFKVGIIDLKTNKHYDDDAKTSN